MRYYDIHTHQPALCPEDIAVVNTIIGVSDEKAIQGKEYSVSTVWRSCGIHPWYLLDVQAQFAALETRAFLPEVVAIGEAGLDKKIETPMAFQQTVFEKQADLAEQVAKPLLIHCVKAWDELIAIRKRLEPRAPWIIHGFRGNGFLAAQLIRQGFLLSFGEYFHPEAVRAAWPEYLFAETDDRELDIRSVYRQLSVVLEVPTDRLLAQLAENVHFSFPSLPF